MICDRADELCSLMADFHIDLVQKFFHGEMFAIVKGYLEQYRSLQDSLLVMRFQKFKSTDSSKKQLSKDNAAFEKGGFLFGRYPQAWLCLLAYDYCKKYGTQHYKSRFGQELCRGDLKIRHRGEGRRL